MSGSMFFYEQPTFIESGFNQYWYPDQEGILRVPQPVRPEDSFILPPLPRWSEPERSPTVLEGLLAALHGRLPRLRWQRRYVALKLPVILWRHPPEPSLPNETAEQTLRAVAKEQGYI